MDMNEYQEAAASTDTGTRIEVVVKLGADGYRDRVRAHYIYLALGLAGETGEVVEKIKKAVRDDYGRFTDSGIEAIKLELGDVLWYLTRLASELGLSLDVVAQANLDKLEARKARGKLHGEGDNR